MKTILISLFIVISSLPITKAQENNTITVIVKNIQNDNGHAVLSIFKNDDGFPMEVQKAMRKLKAPIQNGVATFKVTNLAKREYAFAVIHDENKNGILDTNFIGMPTEGACASNNAKGRFGPPKFKDTSFIVGETNPQMNLKMIYF